MCHCGLCIHHNESSVETCLTPVKVIEAEVICCLNGVLFVSGFNDSRSYVFTWLKSFSPDQEPDQCVHKDLEYCIMMINFVVNPPQRKRQQKLSIYMFSLKLIT